MFIQSRTLAALAVSSLFACGAMAGAQPPAGAPLSAPAETIDLPAAIRLALAQPAARAAEHEAAASQAARAGAASYPNPELSWLREGQQRGNRTTTVQINQPIEFGGKRQARRALADSAVTIAQDELAARRRAIRAEVIAAFYTLLVAREKQALAGALSELAGRSVDAAAKRVAAGKLSPIDATRARLAAVDASVELNRANAELALAGTRLGALIGRQADPRAPGQAAEQLPEPAPLASLQAGLEDSAAVRRAQGQLAAQLAQTRAERAARVPDLTLSLGTKREDGVARRQTVVGLALPLPLFERNAGRLGEALRRRDAAQEALAAARVAAASELASAHARYALARGEAALLRQDLLPQAESAHALTLKGFDYGKFSMLEVLDAQRTLFQSRTRYWDTLLEAWRAYAELDSLGAGTIEQTRPEEFQP